MTQSDCSAAHGISRQYLSKLIGASVQEGKDIVTVRGASYKIHVLKGRGRGGKTYDLRPVPEAPRRAGRRRGTSRVDMAALEGLGVDLDRIDTEGRLAVVRYVLAHPEYSLYAVAWGFGILFGREENTKSLERRIRRWIKAYQEGGRDALSDRRGGSRGSAVDRELFMMSIVKSGTLDTYYGRYCAFWCQREGVEIDVFAPQSHISYTGFVRYYHQHKEDNDIKAILRGMDAIDELLPVYSMASQLSYPNQQWQIDATSIDIMVKVPLIDGEPQYFLPIESDQYRLVRYTLNGLVDAYSAARVYKLMLSGTSYGNVRLLEKAIHILGVPELIKGDNGKDYVSEHFQGVLEDLGIVYHAATPYKGSEKGKVERGFRTLQHNSLFESLPGFVGHSVAQRQTIEAQAAKKSQRGGAGTQTNLRENFLWWWEAERALDGLIAKMFAEQMQEHRAVASYGRTIPHLHERLGKKSTRKLSREGIRYRGDIYTSTAIWERYRIGDSVTIHEEIDDESLLYIASDAGDYITASSDRAAITLEEAQESKRAYKRRETAKIKQIVRSGKQATAAHSDLIAQQLQEASALAQPHVISHPINKPVSPETHKGEAMRDEIIRRASGM